MAVNNNFQKVDEGGFPFRSLGKEIVRRSNPQDQSKSCSLLPFLCFCDGFSNYERHESRKSRITFPRCICPMPEEESSWKIMEILVLQMDIERRSFLSI
jgi:hypothetical protein